MTNNVMLSKYYGIGQSQCSLLNTLIVLEQTQVTFMDMDYIVYMFLKLT